MKVGTLCITQRKIEEYVLLGKTRLMIVLSNKKNTENYLQRYDPIYFSYTRDIICIYCDECSLSNK
ncbi:MAG: hypothetical protein CO029_01370 [Candidatus Magasanikbacteria bacterium CG_4_9_14_0_2_um_filter_41_10]|nr:MAG: hypothetical protein AUJ37_03550 [Candidatus Magasanikbacteria bacterium CG1_02_41_34]PJC53695.1 MAG: hypothetical protein CO029_01370 [Candidatus Magasanikbacteria bacterium CG_4_9_14_0_2_um_filter_41_10]